MKTLENINIEEIWCFFPYNKDYKVSNLGRVKSIKKGKEIFLKERINKQGYYQLGFWNKGVMTSWKTHILVSICFLGHKPCGMKYVINHKDLNKLNNKADNLEITTPRENSNRKHLKSSSKYVGVSFSKEKRKFISYIHINGRLVYLGNFTEEIKAHEMYQNALLNINNFNGDVNQFRNILNQK